MKRYDTYKDSGVQWLAPSQLRVRHRRTAGRNNEVKTAWKKKLWDRKNR